MIKQNEHCKIKITDIKEERPSGGLLKPVLVDRRVRKKRSVFLTFESVSSSFRLREEERLLDAWPI